MATETEQLVHLATIMAKALVDHSDAVRVVSTVGEHVVILELFVNGNDIGKVIGKQGIYAEAMRTLLSAAAGKLGKSVVLEVTGRFHGSRGHVGRHCR